MIQYFNLLQYLCLLLTFYFITKIRFVKVSNKKLINKMFLYRNTVYIGLETGNLKFGTYLKISVKKRIDLKVSINIKFFMRL